MNGLRDGSKKMLWTLLAAVIGYFAAKHLLIKRDSPNTVGLLGFTIIVLAIAANTLFSTKDIAWELACVGADIGLLYGIYNYHHRP